MRRVAAGAALAVLLALPVAGADAAGLRDLRDGWLLDPDETVACLDPRPPGAAPGAGVRWACGAGRLHGLPELDLRFVEAAAHGGAGAFAWRVAASWQVLGDDPYRAGRWTASVGAGGRWRVGVRWGGEREDLAGVPGPVHRELDLVLGGHGGAGDGVAATWELHVPLDRPAAAARRRVRRAGRVVVRSAGAAVALVADRRGDGRMLLGWDLQLTSGDVALGVRYDGGSGSLGPGLAVRRGPMLVRTHHAVHPLLGVSHRAEVVVATHWRGAGP